MDDFGVKIINLERQIQYIRPYVNEHLDTAPNDEERDFFDAVAYAINGMLHFLKEVKEDKRLEAIDRLAHYSSLKYVDDKIVAFNRQYYDKNKQEHPREPTQTEFVDEPHEQNFGSGDMPLDKAVNRTKKKKCLNCWERVEMNGVSYCGRTRKIIHPLLLRPDSAGCPLDTLLEGRS